MTTMTPPTDTPPPPPPPAGPPVGPPVRRLQRSTTDKVAGGVAGGLGEYFGLDPVLFRVLFAVAAFFGGFGVVAYAVLWFALPEPGDTQTSPVDRLGGWLAAHRIPLWAAGIVAVVAFWVLVGGFGGWATHGLFFPGAAVIGVVLLVVAFSRRGATRPPVGPPPGGPGPAADPTVSLVKPGDPAADDPFPTRVPGTEPGTPWGTEPGALGAERAERPMEQWYREARERGRARRRRARPLFWSTLGTALAALAVVVVADAVSGVALPVYAYVGGGVVLLGLLAGIATRRPAFSLLWFLVPALVWVFAFGATHVSFRDGAGDVAYRPTSAADLQDDYRLAFGRVTLDLTGVYDGAATTGTPSTVTVRVGAGVARVVVPRDADVAVVTTVRAGTTLADGRDPGDRGRGGWRTTTRFPAVGDDGPAVRVVLQVADGVAVVDHVSS